MKKIRIGMIGGGIGSGIGEIHRYAARLDNCYDLVAGAFSREIAKSRQLGDELGINHARIYADAEAMFVREQALPAHERIEAVSIATPNHSHFEIAKSALASGLHVIIDKPLTITLQEALALQRLHAQRPRQHCCVTYTYSGYPMIKEARALIEAGRLGRIHKVLVDFPQGWLSRYADHTNKQAAWRQDAHLGIAGTIADIGTHAFHLAEYVSALTLTHVCAELRSVVPEHALDDDASVLLRFDNGASGVITITQVAAGEEANLSITVHGEIGSLSWEHKNANHLQLQWLEKPAETLTSGKENAYLSDIARYNCRTAAGHPEGYIEAFANHYRNFAHAIRARESGEVEILPAWEDYPNLMHGVRGMAFIEAALQSAKASEKKWQPL